MMMTDYKAIADRLVDRGVLKWYETAAPSHSKTLVITPWGGVWAPKDACHDWRVAGACMERFPNPSDLMRFMRSVCEIYDDSLPLAIILAYLECSESENKRGDSDGA